MELVQTTTLGSAVASLSFASIPQDATDLCFSISSRFDHTNTNFDISFNGSNTNSTTFQIFGTGSTAIAVGGAGSFYAYGTSNDSSYTADTFSNAQLYIFNYASSVAKQFLIDGVTENNATTALSTLSCGLWNPSTQAAITSVSFSTFLPGQNFVAGTTFSLYKITKGSDGIVTTS